MSAESDEKFHEELRNMRSGAMPDDWHERNDTGYIPGGADKLAEKIMAEGIVGREEEPPWGSSKRRASNEQGWGEQSERPLSGR